MALWMERTDTYKWQDWANLVFAVWLFISPWVLGFYPGAASASVAAAWNAWIFAIVIGVFAIAALIKARPWEEWINLIAGAWVFVSPWVLGFYAGHTVLLWNSLIVGALVFALSIWDLSTQPAMAGRHV
jgi:SPW repeat